MKVMVVEDEPISREAIATLVTMTGHEVVLCPDAESAWSDWKKEWMPILLIDWFLPKMDGLELCRRIREAPQGRDCVILMITVKNSSGDLLQILDAGADDYMAKPLNFPLLKIRLSVAEHLYYHRLQWKKAEAILGISERLKEQSDDHIAIVGKDYSYQQVNQSYSTAHGLSSAEIVKMSVVKLIGESNFHNKVKSHIDRALAGETLVDETWWTFKNLGQRYITVTYSPLFSSAHQVESVIIVFRDRTKLKKEELALSQTNLETSTLSRRFIEVQEDERQRIAHVLHDTVGQSLTELKMNLHQFHNIAPDEEMATPLKNSLNIVDGMIKDFRDMSLDLRPSLLDGRGFIQAIREYASRLAKRGDWTLKFHIPEEPISGFNPEEIAASFRFVQEALTNTLQHAQATVVEITLSDHTNALEISVQDNGRGFDTEETRAKNTPLNFFGLRGIQERLQSVGGHMVIDSSPEQGTTVRAHIPLSAAYT